MIGVQDDKLHELMEIIEKFASQETGCNSISGGPGDAYIIPHRG